MLVSIKNYWKKSMTNLIVSVIKLQVKVIKANSYGLLLKIHVLRATAVKKMCVL